MIIQITEELSEILRSIQDTGWSESRWAEAESDDMFQSDSYCGGFDADERAFCFSEYVGGEEYWFQFSLEDVGKALSGHIDHFVGRAADQ